jgi:hypothetical protein
VPCIFIEDKQRVVEYAVCALHHALMCCTMFEEQLKAQRHQLYCSVADLCQQDASNTTAEMLLRQLQALLEAESCFSCIDEPLTTGTACKQPSTPQCRSVCYQKTSIRHAVKPSILAADFLL